MALKLAPIKLTSDAWYYEIPDHIEIIHWVTERDGYRRAHSISIPWRKLNASVRRKNMTEEQKTLTEGEKK